MWSVTDFQRPFGRIITEAMMGLFDRCVDPNLLVRRITVVANHIMENIVYNELLYRGFSVDVGVVEIREKQPDGKMTRKQLEVDFVANSGSRRYYIQSTFSMSTPEKEALEKRPFLRFNDSFKKIILVRENIKIRRDENGIVTMGLLDFLLTPNSLEI